MRTLANVMALVVVAAAASLSFGCSSSATGAGAGADQGSSGGSGTGSASDPASGADGTQASPFDDLFAPPPAGSKATADSLTGVWAPNGSGIDARLKFTADSITVAVRCSGTTQGATVSARVSNSSLLVLESKMLQASTTSGGTASGVKGVSGQLNCGETIPTGETDHCTSGQSPDFDNCFVLDGTKLQGTAFFTGNWFKLSD